jgi:hypothetical protein
MNTVVDPELKAIHNAALNLYNRETLLIKSQLPESLARGRVKF